MTYVIECRRNGTGFLGSATAPAKDKDGRVMTFETRKEAEKQANEWRKNTQSATISYRVRDRTEASGEY